MVKGFHIPSKAITPHNTSGVLTDGAELSQAKAAMIMIHGRGASAESILELSHSFQFDDVSFIAPPASGFTWYPFSFLSPVERNEPGISSGLQRITEIVDYVGSKGISPQKIMLLGFSQGACLALEWTARNARNISAVFGLSGGLIGHEVTPGNYQGSLENTTVFLGCSDVDIHIPKERVLESRDVFTTMNAAVTMRTYPNLPHTVNQDEIDFIISHIERVVTKF